MINNQVSGIVYEINLMFIDGPVIPMILSLKMNDRNQMWIVLLKR